MTGFEIERDARYATYEQVDKHLREARKIRAQVIASGFARLRDVVLRAAGHKPQVRRACEA